MPRPSVSRLLRWFILIALPLCGAFYLARLDFHQRLSTDITDLIPNNRRSPEVRIVNTMLRDRQVRVVLLTLEDSAHPGRQPAQAAAYFAGKLRESPAFAEVVPLESDSEAPMRAVGTYLFKHRLNLLFPTWIANERNAWNQAGRPGLDFSDWAAARAAKNLNDFYASPAAMGFDDELPGDPLLLLPNLLNEASTLGLAAPPHQAGKIAYAHVWALLKASPFVSAGQTGAYHAIDQALHETQAKFPSIALQWTGVNKLAGASKSRIKKEITLLNGLSLGAVLLIAFLLLRKPSCLLHLLPPVGLAVLFAWVVTFLVFGRIQVLVLVIGSILTGITIDYGFHVMLHPRRPNEPFRVLLREIGKPLLASCLTTVAGFSLLMLSALPVIREIGFFVAVGLLSALGTSLLYFSLVRVDLNRVPEQWHWLDRIPNGGRRALFVFMGIVAIAGLVRMPKINWNDDIRSLEMPQPKLTRENTEIRERFGESAGQMAYLSYGPTVADARSALAAFLQRDDAASPSAHMRSLEPVLPTKGSVDAAHRWAADHPAFAGKVLEQLNATGFDPTAFAPFATAWKSYSNSTNPDYSALADGLESRLSGPLGLLMHHDAQLTWFVSFGPKTDIPSAAGETSGTIALSQLQTLNKLFGRYRVSTLHQGSLGLAVIAAGILLIYGLRQGVRIMAVPLCGTLAAFAVLETTGSAFGLFNLLGVFLGIGIALDYALFYATASHEDNPRPTSVLVSALTTIVSFGFLSFSDIPVVHALGSTVCLATSFSLLFAELIFPLRSGSDKPEPAVTEPSSV